MTDTLRVLTVRQPWAGAIVHLGKDVENRPQRWAYRGPVLIHAALYNPMYIPDHTSVCRIAFPGAEYWSFDFCQERGQIIAITEIVDCVDHTDGHGWTIPWMQGDSHYLVSPWYIEGQFGYVLRNTQPITPTLYTGGLGLRRFRHELSSDVGLATQIYQWADANDYYLAEDYGDNTVHWTRKDSEARP